MYTDILIIIVGVAAMLFLAEVIIGNAIEIARYFGLSGTFIGLTVLSVGTSVPEIMSHLVGSFDILRQPESMNAISGLLLGTNIGSDIFQQNFILPVVGLAGSVVVVRSRLAQVMGGLLGAAVLAWVFSLGGVITRAEGLMLVLAYVGYLLYLVKADRRLADLPKDDPPVSRALWLSTALIVVCFAIMAVITERVVTASTHVVVQLPISASFFGVLFLGIATSLPELTTALVSMYRGKGDISAGIMLGSNVTNPLFGIGLGAMVSTYTVPQVTVLYDLPVNIATAVLLFAFLLYREDLSKREALILLASFFVYLVGRWLLFPEDFPLV